jgi:hypothetical protein
VSGLLCSNVAVNGKELEIKEKSCCRVTNTADGI